MRRKGNFHLGVGASSILMIFVVLCLTTFGVLSYVTANADNKISTKNAETVENYYAATAIAEQKLQKIDEALLSAREDAAKAADGISLTQLSEYNQYKSRSELRSVTEILAGNASAEQKKAVCYRSFAQMLLTRLDGVTVEPSDGDSLNVRFLAGAGAGRQIETRLAVGAFDDAERYRITERKLTPQALESGGGDTLELWQGNSAQ
ncbi:hypothetical protein [Caproiciproducens sp. CPB-2]|uniref:hypothetical protein n=1 Tax=Caproiciproducens sp. CPB-2 TaxID=3030017 RepID=UPI0023DC086F|nr:hypothetical protein [Caproiciproducens sp. CPB-2]MDF1494714.1 hypothetical protein [Caproiciproducens sp. CPB-2]